jgi:glutamate--cysteine ligase
VQQIRAVAKTPASNSTAGRCIIPPRRALPRLRHLPAAKWDQSLNAHRQQQLRQIIVSDPTLLRGIGRGIEKESLRVTSDGTLAQTPHPPALGAALTHDRITTDYSESLLEFITPVSRDIDGTLNTLEDIHSFVYRHLDRELLWSSSMPCIVAGDAGIPVARYGSSNVGRMKTVYRNGLGHRYGRLMQAIAGVHYNFSMPEAYWQAAHGSEGSDLSLQDYITSRYLDLIRNFHRWSWLLIYLFGASPAVCASFMRGRGQHPLQPFDERGQLPLPAPCHQPAHGRTGLQLRRAALIERLLQQSR